MTEKLIKSTADHDLLIELKTRMEALRDDIRDLKDGTTTKIADHETRIFALESSKTKSNTLISVGIGVLTVLSGLIAAHMFGVG